MRLYSRALSYFLPDWKRIALLVLLIIMIVGLSTALAWPMAILIDVILKTGQSEPKSGFIYDNFRRLFAASPLIQIPAVAGIYFGIKLLLDLLSCLRVMLSNSLKYRGTVRVRLALFRHFQALGSEYHNTQPQGDAIFRLSNDTFGPFGVFDTLFTTGQDAATLISVSAVMFTRSVPLTLFALSLAPAMLVSTLYFGRIIKRRADESRRVDSHLMTIVQRAMSTVHLIQVYSRQRHEEARYDESLGKSVSAAMRLHWQESLYPFVVQCIYGVGQAALIGYGGYLVYRDQIAQPVPNGVTYGDLMLFIGYFSQMVTPLAEVAGFTARVKTSVAASERVFSVLDQTPTIADLPGAIELPLKRRTLRIENVSFGYEAGHPILRNISAQIAPGEMVAFVGASGTGKSTLLHLISRFHEPSTGQIFLDNLDLRRITLGSLRHHLVVVSQENGLLAGTIEENIRYGSLAATDVQLRDAAQLAGAAEFIERLPRGYATPIVEAGKNLSGGQRQRLAIARALLTAAPILLFDEPTSALDAQTERFIADTLAGLKRTRTILLVTHRLASVRDCDRIYVMHGGRIIDQGTYPELLARKSLDLVRMEQEHDLVA